MRSSREDYPLVLLAVVGPEADRQRQAALAEIDQSRARIAALLEAALTFGLTGVRDDDLTEGMPP